MKKNVQTSRAVKVEEAGVFEWVIED